MLQVGNFKKAKTRSTESAVEKLWAATWREMDIYSRHMSDALAGLPDRYVQGGRWVEFKSLYRVRGGFTYGEGLSTEQKRTMADLAAAGDKVFYCAQLDGWSAGKRYIFLRWEYIASRINMPITQGAHDVPANDQSRRLFSGKSLA